LRDFGRARTAYQIYDDGLDCLVPTSGREIARHGFDRALTLPLLLLFERAGNGIGTMQNWPRLAARPQVIELLSLDAGGLVGNHPTILEQASTLSVATRNGQFGGDSFCRPGRQSGNGPQPEPMPALALTYSPSASWCSDAGRDDRRVGAGGARLA
jgi:hypothetical protein